MFQMHVSVHGNFQVCKCAILIVNQPCVRHIPHTDVLCPASGPQPCPSSFQTPVYLHARELEEYNQNNVTTFSLRHQSKIMKLEDQWSCKHSPDTTGPGIYFNTFIHVYSP